MITVKFLDFIHLIHNFHVYANSLMGRVLYDCLVIVIGTQKAVETISLFPHFDDSIPGPSDDHTLGRLTQVDVTDDVTMPLGWGFRPMPWGVITAVNYLYIST